MHCTYWSNWPTHHSKTLLLHLMKYWQGSSRSIYLDERYGPRWTHLIHRPLNDKPARCFAFDRVASHSHPSSSIPHCKKYPLLASLLDYLPAPTRRCHDTNYQYWRLLQPKECPRCPDDGAMPWVKGIKISGGESHFKSPLVETSAKIQDIWYDVLQKLYNQFREGMQKTVWREN